METISELKLRGKGCVSGFVTCSDYGLYLKDAIAQIELCPCQDVLLKPHCYYTISCSQLLEGPILPVFPYSIVSTEAEEMDTGICLPCYCVFVMERYTCVKNGKFHVVARVASQAIPGSYTMTLFLKAEWLSYVQPRAFYVISTRTPIVLGENGRMNNAEDIHDIEFKGYFVPELGTEFQFLLDGGIPSHPSRNEGEYETRQDFHSIPANSTVDLDVEVLSNREFNHLNSIIVTDRNKSVIYLNIPPHQLYYPKALLIPGVQVRLYDVLIKFQGTPRRKTANLTFGSHVVIMEVPAATSDLDVSGIVTLQNLHGNTTPGIKDVFVEITSVQKLEINSNGTNVCTLAVSDGTGEASVYIRNHDSLIIRILNISSDLWDRMVGATFKCDQVTGVTEDEPGLRGEVIERIKSQLGSAGWHMIRGVIVQDKTCYITHHRHGMIVKNPRLRIFPYAVHVLSVHDQIAVSKKLLNI